jgi:UDP-N-acetylmuramoyl-tripeptide--D-alanyl-D-alanine ligase
MRLFFKIMQTDHLYSIFKESAGVTTDSRNIRKGVIFFALWGEKYNGNKFASEALSKGAAYAVIDDPDFDSEKTILVDDSLLELQALAAYHRQKLKIPVIAITGTNGKTTTKELIAAILSRKYRINYTKGNLNNHIGVPLTILSTPLNTELLIIEMGASHVGEIKALCEIAKPDHGIITNIGKAHIEGFKSFEGIVETKIELYEYLKKVNGVAIYNERSTLLSEKIFKIVNRAIPYSNPAGTELIIENNNEDIMLSISAIYNHETYKIKTNLFGSYNLENVKAAIATGLFFGVNIKDIVDAIEKYVPANNRSEIRKTSSNILICDSYNSNPASLSRVLEAFVQVGSENKVCIIGDMLELGEKTEEEHLKILNTIKYYGFDRVYLVGNIFEKLADSFGYTTFSDSDLLVSHLKQSPIKDCLILIKGSRGIMLEKIYSCL